MSPATRLVPLAIAALALATPPSHAQEGWVQPIEATFDGETFLVRVTGEPRPAAEVEPDAAPQTEHGQWQRVMTQGFEHDGFPYHNWSVGRATGSPEVHWGRSNHRAATGSWSLYCAAAGSLAAPAGGPYPPGAFTWTIFGPFSLEHAEAARMTFRLWLEVAKEQDVVAWLASRGEGFRGWQTAGPVEPWSTITFDLGDHANLGPLLGEPQVWVAFLFASEEGPVAEGAYIDDVTIERFMPPPRPIVRVSPASLTLAQPGVSMATQSAAVQADDAGAEYAAGRLIVRFREDVAVDAARGLTTHADLDDLARRHGLHAMRPLRAAPAAARRSPLDRVHVLEFAGPVDVRALARAFAGHPAVEYAEPDFLVHRAVVAQPALAAGLAAAATGVRPNDPLFHEQWGLRNVGQVRRGFEVVGTPGVDIRAEAAWSISTGAPGVTIAIVDDGVDATHPELHGRVVEGRHFPSGAPGGGPSPAAYHGTAVAGVAAARGNNGMGMAGVAWNVSVMPLNVFNGREHAPTAAVAEAIVWAADAGADIINLSLGSPTPSVTKRNAVQYAHARGVVIIAAAGNENTTTPSFPAAFPEVISVGALSPCDGRKMPTSCEGVPWGSNFGAGMDLLAPGTRILTLDQFGPAGLGGDNYIEAVEGTSFAAPFVAGVAALIRSVNPSLTNDQVRAVLQSSAADLGPLGYDDETGFGRLHAHHALLLATSGRSGVFLLQNGGNASLSISSITSNQSWLTVSPAAALVVAAGGSHPIKVDVDWGAVSSTQVAHITIVSNDPQTPSLSLPVVVVPAGSARPAEIAFDPRRIEVASEVGQAPTVPLQIRNTGHEALVFDIATEGPPGDPEAVVTWLRVNPASGSVPGGGATIVEVTLDARALGPGVHEGVLRIRSNAMALPEVTIPVTLLLPVTSAEEQGAPPEQSFDGAFPNPARDRLTIAFTLPRPAAVRVEVFDMLGRRAAALSDALFPAGEHRIDWQPAALAGGVYVVRITADDQVMERRVTILR